jgi:hypothetical protein
MLNVGADFWLYFWVMIGGGAALTVLASAVVARFQLDWFRCEHATVHTLPAEQTVQTRKAA